MISETDKGCSRDGYVVAFNKPGTELVNGYVGDKRVVEFNVRVGRRSEHRGQRPQRVSFWRFVDDGETSETDKRIINEYLEKELYSFDFGEDAEFIQRGGYDFSVPVELRFTDVVISLGWNLAVLPNHFPDNIKLKRKQLNPAEELRYVRDCSKR